MVTHRTNLLALVLTKHPTITPFFQGRVCINQDPAVYPFNIIELCRTISSITFKARPILANDRRQHVTSITSNCIGVLAVSLN